MQTHFLLIHDKDYFPLTTFMRNLVAPKLSCHEVYYTVFINAVHHYIVCTT